MYSLKTEGRFVTLWVRNADDVSIFGTGGCGCSSNDTVLPQGFASGWPATLYRVENTTNFQFASLVDQHSFVKVGKVRPRDVFDESPCPPSITHMLYVRRPDGSATQTAAFDRPALYVEGSPRGY